VDTLFDIHSTLRWLIVLFGFMAAIWLAIGFFGKRPYDRGSRILMMLFATSIDIQVLIGFIYFLWSGTRYDYWRRERWEHMVVMIVALILVHMPMRWRKADPIRRYRNDLLIVVCTLVAVFIGVALLLGGMERWNF